MHLFFVSKSRFKHEEARQILAPLGIAVEADSALVASSPTKK